MEFSFKNVNRDIKRWLETYGPDCPRDDEVKRVGKIGKAERIVLDAYFNAKSYKALVDYELGMNAVVDYEAPVLHRLTDALVKDRKTADLLRLWKGVIAKRKGGYWTAWSYRNKIDGYEGQIAMYRTHVIAGYNRFLRALSELGRRDEYDCVREELSQFESGKLKKLATKPDARKIDEELFWVLLASARSKGDSIDSQSEFLIGELKEFSGPDIKRFQRILNQKMRECYHWNVWALAYCAQDGCSDDAFEAFRAWLIFAGKENVRKAIDDPSSVVKVVPEGLGTNGESLLHAPGVAYELRTGKPLVATQGLEAEPRGKAWEESELHVRFPKLWEYYERIRERM